MNEKVNDMKNLGFDGRFEALSLEYPNLFPARVTAREKGLYRVVFEKGESLALVSGKLRHEAVFASAFPAVGDFVMIETEGETAVIHAVLERKSAFLRRAAGTRGEEQIVAANVDTAFVCMALDGNFNLRRLERYLSAVWESKAKPVVLLTKSDLCADVKIMEAEALSVSFGADVFSLSRFDGDFSPVLSRVGYGKTATFIGSSGVGKSTLINRLLGEERLKTGSTRRDGKGRHTTTSREMFLLPGGGTVIDTPGMRELGLFDAFDGVEKTFEDIETLSKKCRFSDCGHGNEPGCAVRAAIENGELSIERLLSYKKLQTENEYTADSESYLRSKQEKFKTISKINKSNRRNGGRA